MKFAQSNWIAEIGYTSECCHKYIFHSWQWWPRNWYFHPWWWCQNSLWPFHCYKSPSRCPHQLLLALESHLFWLQPLLVCGLFSSNTAPEEPVRRGGASHNFIYFIHPLFIAVNLFELGSSPKLRAMSSNTDKLSSETSMMLTSFCFHASLASLVFFLYMSSAEGSSVSQPVLSIQNGCDWIHGETKPKVLEQRPCQTFIRKILICWTLEKYFCTSFGVYVSCCCIMLEGKIKLTIGVVLLQLLGTMVR